MSISVNVADKIRRLMVAHDDIITALQSKGVSASDHGFEDFATDISSISGGGGGTDTSDATLTSGAQMLSPYTAYSKGTKYTGSITTRTSSNVTASGATVTIPAGYYASQVTKSVSSGTAGTPTATKGSVSNHSVSITPSVTNTSGYITGSTKTGTAVSVSASELVSGNKEITANGTNIDVADYATVSVNVAGSTDIATGTLTVASNVSSSASTKITDTSTIGFTPTKFIFYKSARTATNNHVHQATFTTMGSYYIRTMTRYSSNALSTSGNTNNWTTQTAGYLYFNSNNVYFRSSSSYILSSGTWYWVAIA